MKAVKTRIEPDKTSAVSVTTVVCPSGVEGSSLPCLLLQIYGTDKWAKLGLLQQTKQRLEINVLEENDETMVFDLCGVEAPFANALRRILISEVRNGGFTGRRGSSTASWPLYVLLHSFFLLCAGRHHGI